MYSNLISSHLIRTIDRVEREGGGAISNQGEELTECSHLRVSPQPQCRQYSNEGPNPQARADQTNCWRSTGIRPFEPRLIAGNICLASVLTGPYILSVQTHEQCIEIQPQTPPPQTQLPPTSHRFRIAHLHQHLRPVSSVRGRDLVLPWTDATGRNVILLVLSAEWQGWANAAIRGFDCITLIC